MAQFKVGGKVVAIETRTFRIVCGSESRDGITIKKGEIFMVLGLNTCKCGCVSLDIGFTSNSGTTQCHKCKHVYANGNTWFVRSTSFLPIEEQEFKQVTYTSILESIPAGSN